MARQTAKSIERKEMKDRYLKEAGEGFDAMFPGIEGALEGGCTKGKITYQMAIAVRDDALFDIRFKTTPSFNHEAQQVTGKMEQGVLKLA